MPHAAPRLEPAACLDDIARTLSPKPLVKPEEFKAFYRDAPNKVRGGTGIAHLRRLFRAAHWQTFYKVFLVGHPGVGKSTELTRLIDGVEGRFRALRFSVMEELDPGAFEPFDVLALIVMRLVEETARPTSEGGAGHKLNSKLLQDVLDWLGTRTVTEQKQLEVSAQIQAGVNLSDSLWEKVLGLFADMKGEARYATVRQVETVEYHLRRMSDFVRLVNRVAGECNEALRTVCDGAEWLVVGEDFDKPGIPVERTEALFLTYGNLFQDLDLHLVFTLPITLAYSGKAAQLPLASDSLYTIPDTPVFERAHRPHDGGRAALGEVLAARVNANLFDGDTRERLIVASGGNLRDLFSLVRRAALEALVCEREHISAPDAAVAVSGLRTEYENRLGQSPHDDEPITFEQKADKLVAIYKGEAVVPDDTLHVLLRARAVQEFNGERWFGVHPLVVDILAKHEKLKPEAGEQWVRGGTRDLA